ncbi:MAG: dockerin type I domain-containing protein, partial [Phycisphaerales bacterium]
PTINNLLDNDANGYNIAGPETFASIGDPRAAAPASGGTGWAGAFDPFVDGSNGFPADGVYQVGESFTDLNGNGVRDAFNAESGLSNSNPAIRNNFAAEYLNNISRSIQSFVAFGQNQADFTPGEFLALNFILVAATDNVPDPLDPKALIPNTQLNQALQDNIRANNTVFTRAEYQSFNTNTAGIVPTRTPRTTGTYTDGGTSLYVQQNGSTIAGGGFMNIRNRISGDFNQDGVRDINDTAGMIAAVTSRATFVAPTGIYTAGTEGMLALDVIGDFNNDGNFNSADVRYFADGLALSGGSLDRKAAFIAVDAAFGGNFFGTTKAHGTYQNGDSRADIAGAIGTTPGYAPVGSDGAINGTDIDYVFGQFARNARVTDGELNWSNLNEAVGGDLSADINGDLKINQDDITEILSILGTTLGDVNLDGTVDAADLAIATGNLGTAGGWARGDMNGDGQITQADLDIISAGIAPACDPDVNQDGNSDQGDIDYLINVVAGGENPTNIDPDFNRDGNVDQGDVDSLINVVAGGQCP